MVTKNVLSLEQGDNFDFEYFNDVIPDLILEYWYSNRVMATHQNAIP